MADDNTVTSGSAAPPDDSCWVVYLLRCADRTLYTGVTADLERRLRQHNGELAGGARYTRGRRPVAVVWAEAALGRADAQQREALIRRLPRRDKERLIAGA